MNILFLCTGNSCRSIIAEALLRSLAPKGVGVQSAGSSPAGFVHPQALVALKKAKIDVSDLASKSWDDLLVKPDVVITLCADAEGEPCPLYFGKLVRSHWGMPDPAKVQGSEAEIAAAFDNTLYVLNKKVHALVKVLTQNPQIENLELENALDLIAKL